MPSEVPGDACSKKTVHQIDRTEEVNLAGGIDRTAIRGESSSMGNHLDTPKQRCTLAKSATDIELEMSYINAALTTKQSIATLQSTGMEQVFLLPELLEAVLSHLPQRDLLLAQRVNRTWHDVISSSRLLQQRLFFQTTRSRMQLQEGFTVVFNPLLQCMFPAFYPDDETLDWTDSCIGTSSDCYRAGPGELRAQEWLNVWLGGCCCGGNTIAATLGSKYQSVNQSSGPRMGLLWDAIIFVLDDNPDGWFKVSWWRNEDRHEGAGAGGSGGSGEKKWSLEWVVKTEHRWECYQCDESYIPTGLKVVDDEDLVVYEEDDDTLMDMEATPLSVRRRNPTQ
ncbi:hypothetical protein BDW68DRAFT_182747 [Aspergillus falconensis]